MKLWLLSQDKNLDWDTFDSCVVAAETEDEARHIHPKLIWDIPSASPEPWDVGTWAAPKYITVTYLGVAEYPFDHPVICASFNAG